MSVTCYFINLCAPGIYVGQHLICIFSLNAWHLFAQTDCWHMFEKCEGHNNTINEKVHGHCMCWRLLYYYCAQWDKTKQINLWWLQRCIGKNRRGAVSSTRESESVIQFLNSFWSHCGRRWDEFCCHVCLIFTLRVLFPPLDPKNVVWSLSHP